MIAAWSGSPVWLQLEAGRQAHHERYRQRVYAFLEKYHAAYRAEITRAADSLCRDDLLRPHLSPLAQALDQYLYWLRWGGWLSAQLAPPLALEAEEDARRLAVAVMTYLGARLVDDGMDDHRDFKRKQVTVLGTLERLCPRGSPAALCCASALLGFWVLNHGQRRFRQLGLDVCADTTAQLFARIPPGALAEVVCGAAITRDEYARIVQRKAVAYDMILYQNLLAPADPRSRGPLLAAVAISSEIAQYLNDLMDLEDDAGRRQLNLIRHGFETPETFWAFCLERAASGLSAVEHLSQPLRDAAAAILAEVFEASLTLWGEESPAAAMPASQDSAS
ncbi:MAG TPA: hypothetical protein VF173_38245 [Thermoanaerobaculia bacterium]|nr:hypothetical protein [Thermoanaerobaculia bacterium]